MLNKSIHFFIIIATCNLVIFTGCGQGTIVEYETECNIPFHETNKVQYNSFSYYRALEEKWEHVEGLETKLEPSPKGYDQTIVKLRFRVWGKKQK